MCFKHSPILLKDTADACGRGHFFKRVHRSGHQGERIAQARRTNTTSL